MPVTDNDPLQGSTMRMAALLKRLLAAMFLSFLNQFSILCSYLLAAHYRLNQY